MNKTRENGGENLLKIATANSDDNNDGDDTQTNVCNTCINKMRQKAGVCGARTIWHLHVYGNGKRMQPLFFIRDSTNACAGQGRNKKKQNKNNEKLL